MQPAPRPASARRQRRPAACGWGAGAVAIIALAAPASALAVDWTFTPRVTVSAEVTDNARLAPRGEEDSDLIGTLAPGFTLRGEGARSDTRLDYRMNARFYADDSRQDRTTHSLRGASSWELVDDTFFVDVGASRTEQAASILAPVGIGGSTPRENLQETTTYSISPMLRTRYGSFATQEVRYTYGENLYHRSNRQDSDYHRAEYVLDSGAAFNRPFWQVAGFYEKERFEDGLEGEFGQISGTLGYRFGRSLRLFGVAGQDFNDYATTREDDDGGFWQVGAGWAPTRVTNIEARYGERYFGKNRSLAVDHRSRRSTYRISYSEGVTSTRQRRDGPFAQLAEDAQFMSMDELLENYTLEEIFLFALNPELGDEAFVEGFYLTRSWRAGWSYDTGRSVFGINLSQTERESETQTNVGLFEDNRTQRGANAFWQWRYGPRTTTLLTTGISRTDFADSDREDDLWFLRASVSRQLTPDTSASLAYRHQRRDSNAAANEYRENAIIGTLTKEF
ncbi:TIGR03016 family PEP-CTERM system-associated outer membrane protein [Thioalkalivibrio sp. ALJ16]|uniref:TIGR03016 family PEP-CTERM system-associated outer membrane protein n=1 Tax=Thioalkalivibrio sp. ALJ16 TaxID=1158762 RepID=UPI000372D55C|nr:TIGR03016 family PEP-CTERM system-associated outer membrane protein [Thioalkalivibrio sp. ALJ16]